MKVKIEFDTTNNTAKVLQPKKRTIIESKVLAMYVLEFAKQLLIENYKFEYPDVEVK
jgi:hypothetical protein